MSSFAALYGRPCRSPSCWIESGNRLVLGPDVILEASDKVEEIKKRSRAAQDRQKKYADRCRRNLEFSVGDQVFLKVSPLRNVIRFGRRGKLSPRFIGPFRIVERVGSLAYRLDLPKKLSGVHNVFYVSHLRRHLHDPSLIVHPSVLDSLDIEPNLAVERKPLRIVDRGTKQLRRKSVNLVKVQWSTDDRDCTWKTEESILASNPKMFISGTILFFYLVSLYFSFRSFRGRKVLSGEECNNIRFLNIF